MKRIIISFLIFVLLFCAAACARNGGVALPETPAPFTGAPITQYAAETMLPETAAPSPTDAAVATALPAITLPPTAVPETEAPTAEPTPTILSFEECAEEVLRLVPLYTDESPYLPEDAADNEVRYGDVDFQDGPEIFAVYDDTIVVGNIAPMMYDLKVFKNGRFVRRVICGDINHDGGNFAVTDSMLLYKEIGVYSLETGELVQDTTTTYLMQPIPRDAHSFAAQFTEQGPSIIACVNKNSESPYDICCDFDYFRLDSDSGIWHKTETICREVASFSDEVVRFILNNGKEIAFAWCWGNRLIGRNSDGDLFFLRDEGTAHRLIRVNPEGVFTAEVEIPIGHDDLWDNELRCQLAADGSVYVAASLNDAYVVWRIDLGGSALN